MSVPKSVTQSPLSAVPTTDPAPVDVRLDALRAWLVSIADRHAIELDSLAPASADASFRRYFRVRLAPADANTPTTAIVMDAPPERENTEAFVHVAHLMADAGVHVPQILEQDLSQGFLLLTDLGTRTYLSVVDGANPTAAAPLMLDAIDALIAWQLASRPDTLPHYDEAMLRRELALFPDWYVARHLGITLDTEQRKVLDHAFDLIVANNLAEARVYVHRDFMPRNLMVGEPGHNPGVLDFQDAVYGPISYDIACLCKDAFLSWDEEPIIDWTVRYWERAKKAGLPVPEDFGSFYRDVEWMGLQRHLKVLGIFARINYRDGKPHYLADTPRFLGYVRATADRYRALGPLLKLIDQIEGRVVEYGYTF
jgi:aminoglycoside/choline kinase family phosphotransferase